MAKSFWSYFGLYDGAVRCQVCNREQQQDKLEYHEPGCSIAKEATQWYRERVEKLKAQPA